MSEKWIKEGGFRFGVNVGIKEAVVGRRVKSKVFDLERFTSVQQRGFTDGKSAGAVEIVLLGVIKCSLLGSKKLDLNEPKGE